MQQPTTQSQRQRQQQLGAVTSKQQQQQQQLKHPQQTRFVKKQYVNLRGRGWVECVPAVPDPNVVRLPDQILPNFYIGDWHDAVDCRVVNFLHITHILSIAGVANYVHYKRLIPQHVELMMFCIEDNADVSLRPMLNMACDFIAKGRAAGGVLVHCVAGISRSASFCIAYMLRDLGYTNEHALRVLHDARPVCCPNPGFAKQLLEFEQEIHLITFTVNYNSSWGQVLYIVGETELLGNWRPSSQNKMTWKSSGSWQIQLPVFGQKFQYKYIVVNINSNTELEDPSSIEDSSIIWESCPNRVYEKKKAVFDVWNKPQTL